MKEIILYKDIDLSLTIHPLTGDIQTKTNADAVKRSLRHLIFWEKWDYPFSALHHNHLRDSLFDNPTLAVRSNIRTKIIWLIEAFEPRVKVIDVIVDVDQSESQFVITIVYHIVSLMIEDKITHYIQRVR